MEKEKIKKIFKDTFIAIEIFKQNRIKLSIDELKKHIEMDDAMEAICELFKAYKESKFIEDRLKNGIATLKEDKKNDN